MEVPVAVSAVPVVTPAGQFQDDGGCPGRRSEVAEHAVKAHGANGGLIHVHDCAEKVATIQNVGPFLESLSYEEPHRLVDDPRKVPEGHPEDVEARLRHLAVVLFRKLDVRVICLEPRPCIGP